MRVAIVTLTGLLLAGSAFAQNPCTASGGKGVDDKNAPIVCINPETGFTDPADVTAYSGATVQFWFTDSNDELDVKFKPLTKVKNKTNSGPKVTVLADDVDEPQAPKKYDIHNKSSGKKWDPTIIIEPAPESQLPAPPVKTRRRLPKE